MSEQTKSLYSGMIKQRAQEEAKGLLRAMGSIPGKWILCNSSAEESEQSTQNANSLHVVSVTNVDQRQKERL
jgi:hypothetical protein